jgi:hypothetical protein
MHSITTKGILRLVAPDGWDIERHVRLVPSAPSGDPEMEAQTSQDAREAIDAFNAREEARMSAEQMARELGLAAISEGKARELITLLETSNDEASIKPSFFVQSQQLPI